MKKDQTETITRRDLYRAAALISLSESVGSSLKMIGAGAMTPLEFQEGVTRLAAELGDRMMKLPLPSEEEEPCP